MTRCQKICIEVHLYMDFKTGKKVDIEADIVYCYNYQQSKEVLEDSEEL